MYLYVLHSAHLYGIYDRLESFTNFFYRVSQKQNETQNSRAGHASYAELSDFIFPSKKEELSSPMSVVYEN